LALLGFQGEGEIKTETVEVEMKEEVEPVAVAPPPIMVTQHPTISTRPRSLDIFSTALASANINLDSFMEEEDGRFSNKLVYQQNIIRYGK